jgi:hypothetical protein
MSTPHPSDDPAAPEGPDEEHDPFADPEASPRGATPLAVVALALGVAAALTSLTPIAGPAGMVVGLVAHAKGSRLGMPATVVSALGMVVGMAVIFLLR